MLGRVRITSNPRSQWAGLVSVASVMFGVILLLSLAHNSEKHSLFRRIAGGDEYDLSLSRPGSRSPSRSAHAHAGMEEETERKGSRASPRSSSSSHSSIEEGEEGWGASSLWQLAREKEEKEKVDVRVYFESLW